MLSRIFILSVKIEAYYILTGDIIRTEQNGAAKNAAVISKYNYPIPGDTICETVFSGTVVR